MNKAIHDSISLGERGGINRKRIRIMCELV